MEFSEVGRASLGEHQAAYQPYHQFHVGGISIRSASWLAWSLCALSLALTALSYLVRAYLL
jgi:hypothetical protein